MTTKIIGGDCKLRTKIDFELVDRLNNGDIDVSKTIEKSNENIESKLIWVNGRPKLELKELFGKYVIISSQIKYDTLMQVYELGGWRWAGRQLPTSLNRWKNHKICIIANNGFGYADFDTFANHEKITDKEFYIIQDITHNDLKTIKKYFDKYFPNRKSKG